jgi:hypothetical protein
MCRRAKRRAEAPKLRSSPRYLDRWLSPEEQPLRTTPPGRGELLCVVGVGNSALIPSAYVDRVGVSVEARVGDPLAIGRVGRAFVVRIVVGYLEFTPHRRLSCRSARLLCRSLCRRSSCRQGSKKASLRRYPARWTGSRTQRRPLHARGNQDQARPLPGQPNTPYDGRPQGPPQEVPGEVGGACRYVRR